MEALLSLKTALPLAERIATASDRCSNTGHGVASNEKFVKMSFAFQCMPYKILHVSYCPSMIKFDSGLDVLFHAIPEPVMNNCLIEPVAWS